MASNCCVDVNTSVKKSQAWHDVRINPDYSSCFNMKILNMGVTLGRLYVDEGEIAIDILFQTSKLEAVRILTVRGGGLCGKLAEVLGTQDNYFNVSYRAPRRTLTLHAARHHAPP